MRDEGDTNGGWLLAAHAGWWLTLAVGRDEHPEAFPSPVSLIPHPSSLIPHPSSPIPHPSSHDVPHDFRRLVDLGLGVVVVRRQPDGRLDALRVEIVDPEFPE